MLLIYDCEASKNQDFSFKFGSIRTKYSDGSYGEVQSIAQKSCYFESDDGLITWSTVNQKILKVDSVNFKIYIPKEEFKMLVEGDIKGTIFIEDSTNGKVPKFKLNIKIRK